MSKRRKRKTNGVAYQNKDIVSKLFAEAMKEKSLRVYGVHVPKVVGVLPTNLPTIEVNEQRIDNVFLLEDESYAIIDYESEYDEKNKIKYLGYILRSLRGLIGAGVSLEHIVVRMIVIYTADVTPQQTNSVFDAYGIRLITEEGFLSEIDGDSTYCELARKIESNDALSDEEIMKLIILPLTYKGREEKQKNVEKVVELTQKIDNQNVRAYILAGIISFADKVIEDNLAKKIRGQLTMTKVGKIINDEINEAVEKEVEKVVGEAVEKAVEKAVGEAVEKTTEEVQDKAIRIAVDFAKQANGSMLDVVERIVAEYGIKKEVAEKKVKAVW